MITPEEIHEILERQLPGAEITVEDMTGTADHFQVMVFWQEFKGKTLIQQHRVVHDALNGPLEDGRIHALKIKTFVPNS